MHVWKLRVYRTFIPTEEIIAMTKIREGSKFDIKVDDLSIIPIG